MIEVNDKYKPLTMGDIRVTNSLSREMFRYFKRLRIEVTSYLIMTKGPKIIIVGGDEVIYRDDLSTICKKHNYDLDLGFGAWTTVNETTLLPFTYTSVMLDEKHIASIVKYVDKVNITETEANVLADGNPIQSIDNFEDKIAHIYDNKTYTNSLALAKEFKLIHTNVIKHLLRLCVNKPSLLMSIEFKPYKYIHERNRSTIHSIYLEVSEDVYYYFMQSMVKPKTKEMRIYRQQKMDEYFNSFKVLREDIFIKGYSKEELKRIVFNRTSFSSTLIQAIENYTVHRNVNSLEEDNITFDEMRIIFLTLINKSCNLDMIEHSGFKFNRGVLSLVSQEKIKIKEIGVYNAIQVDRKNKLSLIESLAIIFEVEESELGDWLRESGRGDLWDKLTKRYLIKNK